MNRFVAGAALVAVGVCASCSSTPAHVIPAAPEPAVAPAVTGAVAGTVITLPGVRALPEGVAADPKTGLVAVAIRNPDRLALVDADTMKIKRVTFVPGRARHLVLEKPGGPVILLGEDTNEVVQIALPSGRVIQATTVGKQPHNASYAFGRIYAANELASSIAVVNAKSGKLIATLPGPLQPGGTAVTGSILSAVDVRGAKLYTWNAHTLKPLGSFNIGSGPTHETVVGNGDLVVADTRGNQMLLVDPATRKVVSTLAMPGTPYGIASDPTTGRVWVSLTATNQIVQLAVTSTSMTVTKKWAAVQQPNTLSFDPADDCLFTAGTIEAQLQRICHLP